MAVRLAAAGLLVALFIGCAQPETAPVAYLGPTLTSKEFEIEVQACPASGCVPLEGERSMGRFPTALAVARLTPGEEPCDPAAEGPAPWRVATVKPQDAAAWSSLFQSMPDVREVVVLDPLGLEDPSLNLAQLAKAAGRRQAGLCLVYGPALAEPDAAALLGVMLETHTGRPLALLRAEAGPTDFEPPPGDRPKQDLRHRDVNALAEGKFQAQVRACAIRLIGNDQQTSGAESSPWRCPATRPACPPVYVIPPGSRTH